MAKTLKRDHDGIVDQDAAIMDYLSGLLDDQDEPESAGNRPAPARFPERATNRGVNLAVIEPRSGIKQPQTDNESIPLDADADWLAAGSPEPQAVTGEEIDLGANQAAAEPMMDRAEIEPDSAPLTDADAPDSDTQALSSERTEPAAEYLSEAGSDPAADAQPVEAADAVQSQPEPTQPPVETELSEHEGADEPAMAEPDSLTDADDAPDGDAAAEPMMDAAEEAMTEAAPVADPLLDDADSEQVLAGEDEFAGDETADSALAESETASQDALAEAAVSEDEEDLAQMVRTELEEVDADGVTSADQTESEPTLVDSEEGHESDESAMVLSEEQIKSDALTDNVEARTVPDEATDDAEAQYTPDEATDGDEESIQPELAQPEEDAEAMFDDEADQTSAPEGVERDFAVALVGKMQFLLPREQVFSEFDLEQPLARIGGAPAFVAGQIEHDGKDVLLIDLAALTGIKPHKNTPRKVVVLGKKGLWGIVAEQPEQIREIKPGQIAWREPSERDKRRVWLAGTVNTEQTAVLDVAGLKASLRAQNH